MAHFAASRHAVRAKWACLGIWQPEAGRRRADNRCMIVFYWVMAVLIVGTFVPSVLYLVLYAVTGEDACMRRARGLWNYTRLFSLFAGNLLIWGHVIVGLWRIWFS